ncbi:hypothetical protein LTR22_026773 [Elasticomyces elasticus]|nr:hypothetical protein LTR22_026773 [Elasticomyces elasticus]KAK4901919.1 hypothetical protein LTR49_027164 [Elasticomyces elasticus]
MTDLDRKRMCQYAEEHPEAKQKQIGDFFGVERSTVSKVLRQQEKYLVQDDGSRPLIERAKDRTPNLEKALGVWARNMERKGLPLTDEAIREKAWNFASTSTTPEFQQSWSSSWMEKFKQKNNLLGARLRKGWLAPENAEFIFGAASTSHTQSSVGTSSVSLQGIGWPFHPQSATSVNSAFTNNTHSLFSSGPLSPTLPSYTPDSGTAPGPSPPLTARPMLPAPASSNAHRPRSQTFPQIDHYMGGTSSIETFTTKSPIAGVLDSPMEEAPEPIPSTNDSVRKTRPVERSPRVTIFDNIRPLPLPAHILANAVKHEITLSTYNSSPIGTISTEDALRALQVVHKFIEQQPGGFLDYQESVTVGQLMEKLKLQSRANTNA